MGQLISLDEARTRREARPGTLERLDAAVGRLDPLVRRARTRLREAVERELVAIAADVTSGRPLQAAARADRLADRLEHPAALG